MCDENNGSLISVGVKIHILLTIQALVSLFGLNSSVLYIITSAVGRIDRFPEQPVLCSTQQFPAIFIRSSFHRVRGHFTALYGAWSPLYKNLSAPTAVGSPSNIFLCLPMII